MTQLTDDEIHEARKSIGYFSGEDFFEYEVRKARAAIAAHEAKLAKECVPAGKVIDLGGDVERGPLALVALDTDVLLGDKLYTRPQQDARDAEGADPLQGAVNWLVEAIENADANDIGGRLHIGYNRASRLLAAAIAAKEQP